MTNKVLRCSECGNEIRVCAGDDCEHEFVRGELVVCHITSPGDHEHYHTWECFNHNQSVKEGEAFGPKEA